MMPWPLGWRQKQRISSSSTNHQLLDMKMESVIIISECPLFNCVGALFPDKVCNFKFDRKQIIKFIAKKLRQFHSIHRISIAWYENEIYNYHFVLTFVSLWYKLPHSFCASMKNSKNFMMRQSRLSTKNAVVFACIVAK